MRRTLLRRLPPTDWALFLIAAVLLGTIIADGRISRPDKTFPMEGDGGWYYAYLPAVFIHHDLDWEWARDLGQLNREGRELFGTVPSKLTGRRVSKYSVGVAMLTLPFFAVAHGVAAVFGFEPDGYSAPYRVAVTLGAVCYCLLALVVLRRLLRLFFSEWVTAATLIALALATNLFYFTVRGSLMSHVYSFFALALVMYSTCVWHREGRCRQLVLLGVAAGLTIVIRPVNGIVLLVPLLWGLTAGLGPQGAEGGLQAKARYVFSRWRQLVPAGAALIAILLPQVLYWRVYAGSWLYYSYGTEGFLFDEPMIADVLISYRKGWLLYSPIMATAMLGLLFVRRSARGAELPLAVYAVANIYVVSCWWNWWYGGGFGMRALIGMSAPLALAMASTFAWLAERRIGRVVSITLITGACALNLIQTRQYCKGYINPEGMTSDAYWRVFCRAHIPREERAEIRSLLDPPDKNGRRHRTHRERAPR